MNEPTNQRRRSPTGRGMTWLCGGALAICLLLVAGLMGVIAWEGFGHFWQAQLARVELEDGTLYLGEVWEREEVPDLEGERESDSVVPYRIKLKTGNRSIAKTEEFRWVRESDIASVTWPDDVVYLERLRWGNYHGYMVEIRRGDEVLASGREATWKLFEKLHPVKMEEREALRDYDRGPLGDVNREIEKLRLARRKLEIDVPDPAERRDEMAELDRRMTVLEGRYDKREKRLIAMRDELTAEVLVVEDVDGKRSELPVGHVVRAVRPNQLGFWDGIGLYLARIWEFVSDEPRESNTEGGIFPAIFGTVMMVFIMSLAVVPFGVLAAIYLREYAKQGPVVRAVRIAVNNLAGTPSIVFGVFGLGFFVYLVGGTIDELFHYEALPTHTYGTGGILWASLTLALLTVPVVIVATEEGLAAVPQDVRQGSLALGATKWETLRKVVIPASTPAILTGTILAMARAAGEVAPLMIVGMVKLAPDLPIDGHFPFIHPERKFMHLGFHIYDVGFQSPNVEAVKPVVFATALLLVVIVCILNLVAIVVRNRLRRKYTTTHV